MPRFRPRREEDTAPAPEWAICLTEFRTGTVGILIRSGERRRIDDPLVTGYPQFWHGLVPLVDQAKRG